MFGGICPSHVRSIRIICPSSFQIKSVTALVWKRPVFQSWAYRCLACARRGFSFSRRVTNTALEGTEIHFLIRFPVSRLRRSCCNRRQSTVHSPREFSVRCPGGGVWSRLRDKECAWPCQKFPCHSSVEYNFSYCLWVILGTTLEGCSAETFYGAYMISTILSGEIKNK